MRSAGWTLLVGLSLTIAGCGFTVLPPDGTNGGVIPPPPAQGVTVIIANDTSLLVDPGILYSERRNAFFSFVEPPRTLTTGDLFPGESIEFNFACDRLGIIFSDEAGQYFLDDFELAAIARTTLVLVRGEDFDCGDTIVFQFLGDGAAFGVVVSVNGFVVD